VILLIDNYDSFTFNLYQAVGGLGAQVAVHRNDALSASELLALEPTAVILSPGPGRPAAAGEMPAFLAGAPADLPILGICLGHQALVEHHGGALEVDPTPVHGKAHPVHHDGEGILQGLPCPFLAGRYHSLRASRGGLPADLQLTAWTEDGHVMAIQHKVRPHFGLQFHPESILTPQGNRILSRFLAIAGEAVERSDVA